jgi:hypothetical protein
MREVPKNIGAGEGNRTLVFSLEGCCSTIELHPRTPDQLSRYRSGLNRPAVIGLGNRLFHRKRHGTALNMGRFAAYTYISTTNERR